MVFNLYKTVWFSIEKQNEQSYQNVIQPLIQERSSTLFTKLLFIDGFTLNLAYNNTAPHFCMSESSAVMTKYVNQF